MLKCIQWNIERGYRLAEIVAALQRHQADIICLQELDIACERTGGANVPMILAQALGMRCAFVAEFDELHSPLRSPRLQGGGVHGNAILSVYDFEPFVREHTHHPVDWARDGARIREPRTGQRVILGADIRVPGVPAPIRCYSVHLEVFCGIYGRLRQFADVLADAKAHLADQPLQLIFGDLNTMAHGIARFSPYFCGDDQRLRSIGYSEAQWWQRHIFSQPAAALTSALAPARLGAADVRRLANPLFYDPFCKVKDTTLHGYFGLFRGKLDWTLLRGFRVLAKGMDNHDLRWSDHKLLYVVVRPCSGATHELLEADAAAAHRDGRALCSHTSSLSRTLLGTAVAASVVAYATLRVRDYLRP